MGFREWWRKKEYWKRGAYIGALLGFVKIPFLVLYGESLTKISNNLFVKLPEEIICGLFNLGFGERCGYFALLYGFIYNPIFYGVIGIILGLVYDQFKKRK